LSERYDLEWLRAAFAQPDAAPHPDHCPSLSEIWEGVHGQLPPERLRDVVEHLATCPPCAEAWRLALLMERPTAADQVPAEDAAAVHMTHLANRPRWRLYGGLAAAAAAALFAVVLGVHDFHYLRSGGAPPVIAQRGGAVDQATATRWLAPSDGAALKRSGAVLSWSGAIQTTYDLTVELEDESGGAKPISIVAQHGLTATGYALPERDLARVPAGAHLLAKLTAHLPDGRSETISRNFRLP
jgi:hypothetical protein